MNEQMERMGRDGREKWNIPQLNLKIMSQKFGECFKLFEKVPREKNIRFFLFRYVSGEVLGNNNE